MRHSDNQQKKTDKQKMHATSTYKIDHTGMLIVTTFFLHTKLKKKYIFNSHVNSWVEPWNPNLIFLLYLAFLFVFFSP